MNENEEFLLDLVEEGVFTIDEAGRIWRLQIRGSRYSEYHRLEHPRRAETNSGNGYFSLTVSFQGHRYVAKAHRIVWAHLHGNIDNDLTINHINACRTDNRPENLELVSLKDNLLHAHRLGLICGASPGEDHPLARLTLKDVSNVIRLYETGGYSQKELAHRFNVNQTHISKLVRGMRWQHINSGSKFSRYGAAKLTSDEVRNIRQASVNGQSISELAAHYKVSNKTIERIINRTSWKHI